MSYVAVAELLKPHQTLDTLKLEDNVLQSHFIHSNNDTTSSYATMLSWNVSTYDASLQFFKSIVSPDNILCNSHRVGIVDRIYPVIPDPRRKPDALCRQNNACVCDVERCCNCGERHRADDTACKIFKKRFDKEAMKTFISAQKNYRREIRKRETR
jgi:hypothetical protein